MITEWDEPETIAEALQRKRVLIAQIEEIQLQLGDKRRYYARSREPNYWGWRQSAKGAWVLCLQELRLLKDWLRDQTGGDSLSA